MTCCGKQMRQESGKYVCGKCGAWFQPGVLAVLRLLTGRP